MSDKTSFRRATWRADATLIWLTAPPAVTGVFTWYLGWLEGLGVTFGFLAGLAALPLAFLVCVLLRYYRDIGRNILAFFRGGAETDTTGGAEHPDRLETRLRRMQLEILELRRAINETTKLLDKNIDASYEANQEIAKRQNELIQADIKHLTEWVRALSAAQTETCRVLYMRSLRDEAPAPPGAGDEDKRERLIGFIDDVKRYMETVCEAAAEWKFWNYDEFVRGMHEAELTGEAVFREAHREQRLDAEESLLRRRYAIAREKLRTILRLLDGREQYAETVQMMVLRDLQQAENYDRYRQSLVPQAEPPVRPPS